MARSRSWCGHWALVAALVTAVGACGQNADKAATTALADAVKDTATDAAGPAADTGVDTGVDTAVDAASDTSAAALLLKPVAGETNFAVAAAGWYRGDLHYHTTHSDDAADQGGDDMKGALAVADAFRHPDFIKHNPGLAGNGLDYIAVTDHRTDLVLKDPEFKHPHLILVAGEEFGGAGHAGIWGFQKHIPHDPLNGEPGNTRIQNAVNEAHAQGALFSINHPTQDNIWAWDVNGVDGIEVWNGPWMAFYGPSNEAGVAARAKSVGAENPFIRQAVVTGASGGSNHQALKFWQYHLSDGRHVAPVGGGDRHMLLPGGLPTTYVHAPAEATQTGKALGPQGILEGIRRRSTFVSRSPFAAQVDLSAIDSTGKLFPMGAQLIAGQNYTLKMTVTRAKGGLLRLYSAPLGKTAAGKWPEAQVVLEAPIAADRVQGEWLWQVPAGGAWLHALVLEPVGADQVPKELTKLLDIFTKIPEGKSITDMIKVFASIVDPAVLMYPEDCDPAKWQPWMGQCMTADTVPMTTYYMPEGLGKLMSWWFEDGKPTSWTLGAISSAFMAK